VTDRSWPDVDYPARLRSTRGALSPLRPAPIHGARVGIITLGTRGHSPDGWARDGGQSLPSRALGEEAERIVVRRRLSP
jgi:hypothetical protein